MNNQIHKHIQLTHPDNPNSSKKSIPYKMNKDILYEVLLNLDFPEILKTCKLNRDFYTLCKSSPTIQDLIRVRYIDHLISILETNKCLELSFIGRLLPDFVIGHVTAYLFPNSITISGNLWLFGNRLQPGYSYTFDDIDQFRQLLIDSNYIIRYRKCPITSPFSLGKLF